MTRTYTIANGARLSFGPQVVARGRVIGARMGEVQAPNAADAVRAALRQWPQLSLATTHAIPQEDVDAEG